MKSLVKISLVSAIFMFTQPGISQTTPDYEHLQTHLDEPGAPNWGLNVRYAWQFQGDKGQGIKIVDIEMAWNKDHEDLVGNVTTGGSTPNEKHGTGVLGIMVA